MTYAASLARLILTVLIALSCAQVPSKAGGQSPPAAASPAVSDNSGDWLTWGGGPERHNGVVFSLASGENTRQREYGASAEQRFDMVTNASLHAFDALTGEELYDSGHIIDDWSHFGSLGVANGQVYFTTNDSRVYAFGLP